MSTPTRKCRLIFFPSLSLVNEDRNKEYPLTKCKQFSKCGFNQKKVVRANNSHKSYKNTNPVTYLNVFSF